MVTNIPSTRDETLLRPCEGVSVREAQYVEVCICFPNATKNKKGNKAETREESERVGREERERRARVRRGRENRRGEGKERTEGGRKAVTSRLVIQSNPIHRPDRGESSPSTHASAHV